MLDKLRLGYLEHVTFYYVVDAIPWDLPTRYAALPILMRDGGKQLLWISLRYEFGIYNVSWVSTTLHVDSSF